MLFIVTFIVLILFTSSISGISVIVHVRIPFFLLVSLEYAFIIFIACGAYSNILYIRILFPFRSTTCMF